MKRIILNSAIAILFVPFALLIGAILQCVIFGGQDISEAAIDIRKPFEVESTAFHDKRLCDGTEPREGFTLAGKREWLGKTAMLWTVNEEGKTDKFLGYYEFHDVGYGQSTGYGSSKLIRCRSLGTIEAGECIDIWMPTEADCEKWGRRKLIIQIFDAKG